MFIHLEVGLLLDAPDQVRDDLGCRQRPKADIERSRGIVMEPMTAMPTKPSLAIERDVQAKCEGDNEELDK